MIASMKFLTHRWLRKRWTAIPVNQNAKGGPAKAFRRYQKLMDRIDPGSSRAAFDSALLAKALTGRRASSADEVEICLQSFILLVATHAESKERTLLAVRELMRDPDAMFGSVIMMAAATGPAAHALRLFGKRLRQWPDAKRSKLAAAAARRLAFLSQLQSPS